MEVDVSKDFVFVSQPYSEIVEVLTAFPFPTFAHAQEDSDVPYEEEILRHPYQVKCWLRYVEHKLNTRSPNAAVCLVYERAVKELPGR